jgi:hypothetical protein
MPRSEAAATEAIRSIEHAATAHAPRVAACPGTWRRCESSRANVATPLTLDAAEHHLSYVVAASSDDRFDQWIGALASAG